MSETKGRDSAPAATLPHKTATWTASELPDSCATLEVPVVDPGHYHIVGEVARGGVGRILIYLDGTTLLPITPRRTLIVLCALTTLSMIGSLASGARPLGLRFITLCCLLTSSIVIAVVGAQRGYRIRRAEFYNRYRLQRANERLARLDHPVPIRDQL